VSALEARQLSVRGNDERGYIVQCPAHDDRQASLSISTGDDGRALLCCHAGCSTDEIVAALGLQLVDLFVPKERDDRGAGSRRQSRVKPLPTAEQLAELSGWLLANDQVVSRLFELRGWTRGAMTALALGFDGKRIVFPVRDSSGDLVNVCRYTPSPPENQPKMKSEPRRPRDLFPAPEGLDGDEVWIVEGEPDAVSAHSLGLPAVGLPGVEFVKRLDAGRFARFNRANILLDCDPPGRQAAAALAAALHGSGVEVRVVDLDPPRDDGFDLTDWIMQRNGDDAGATVAVLREIAEGVEPFAPEPAPDGGALLEEIAALFHRYVRFGSHHDTRMLALWVLHTYVLEAAEQTPYLIVTAPQKRCGKSRVLEVLELLCKSAWKIDAAPTEAVLFRKIQRDQPTVLLDEFDLLAGAKDRAEPVVALLNGGNRRGASVPRCVARGNDFDIVDFSTFCPKAIGGINTSKWPDTIQDRAVTIALQRRRKDEPVKRLRQKKAMAETADIRARLVRWGAEHVGALSDAEPECPDGLSDRMEEAWEPLFAIADVAGGEWPHRARQAAVALCGDVEPTDDSLGVRLLADCHAAFGKLGETASTAALLIFLEDLDEAPWSDWRGGRGFNARSLADLLKPYGIRSRTVRVGEKTPKGYHRDQFEDAWGRYLPGQPPLKTPQRHNPVNTGDFGVFDPQHDPLCGGSKNGENPDEHWDVADVADRDPIKADPDECDCFSDADQNGHEQIATEEEEAALERAVRLMGGAQ
jgi:hypothetical protein